MQDIPLPTRDMPQSPDGGADTRGSGDWPFAIAVTLAAITAIGAIFSQEVSGAVRVWFASTTYNHCFLIIPISLYMIWRRKEHLRGVVPRPDFRGIVAIVPLALLWFAASLVGILEAQQFVAMTIIQAAIFGLLGGTVYRRLLAPLLYLYFLVPSGEFLVPALQDFTARFAVLGLQWTGIPVYSDGTMIEIPAGQFVVAEACAGLRFLVAALAFGVFFAVETYRSWTRRLVFIALSIVVPIIANGLRAYALILMAHFLGSGAAIDADHLTFGWVFFSMVLVGLIVIGRSFADQGDEPVPPPALSPSQSPRPKSSQFLVAAVLAVVIAGAPLLAASTLLAPVTEVVAGTTPPVAAPWQSPGAVSSQWRPVVLGADAEFLESFQNGAATVHRFLALYVPRGRGDNLIRSQNRIADDDVFQRGPGSTVAVELGGQPVLANAAELAGPGERLLVWSFYAVDGKLTGSAAEAKWRQVLAYVTASRCRSAFVALATPIGAAGPEAAASVLENYLRAMEPIERFLCAE